jgi:hypothetical protein
LMMHEVLGLVNRGSAREEIYGGHV